jgi:hypothetical protein
MTSKLSLNDIKNEFSDLYLNRFGVWSIGIEADAKGRPEIVARVDPSTGCQTVLPRVFKEWQVRVIVESPARKF